MAKQKTRTKKYQPKPVHVFGGLGILSKSYVNAMPIEEDKQQLASIDYYRSIDAMMDGTATGRNYDCLVYAVNVGLILSENGIGSGYDDLIGPALQAMARCDERQQRTGKFGLDGEGLQAMRDFGPLHEAQLEIATQAEITAAITEMHRRVDLKNKKATA